MNVEAVKWGAEEEPFFFPLVTPLPLDRLRSPVRKQENHLNDFLLLPPWPPPLAGPLELRVPSVIYSAGREGLGLGRVEISFRQAGHPNSLLNVLIHWGAGILPNAEASERDGQKSATLRRDLFPAA